MRTFVVVLILVLFFLFVFIVEVEHALSDFPLALDALVRQTLHHLEEFLAIILEQIVRDSQDTSLEVNKTSAKSHESASSDGL